MSMDKVVVALSSRQLHMYLHVAGAANETGTARLAGEGREGKGTAQTDVGDLQLPIVFLHAFPLNGAMWRPQLDACSARGWTAFAPDLRGFGRTRPLPAAGEVVTPEMMAQDIVALLDFYQYPRAILVGLSMGGYVAMAVARSFPERIAGLVLADTRPGADAPETRVSREQTANLALEKGSRIVAERMVGGLLRPGAARDEKEEVLAIAAQNDPRGVAAASRGMALRPDSTDVLARLNSPSLVLVGEQDGITPVAVAESIASTLPRGRLAVIPRAGHLSNLENPADFNAALLSFLEECFVR